MTGLLIGLLIYAETVLVGAGTVNAVDKNIEMYGPFPPVQVMAKGFPVQEEQNRIARKEFFAKYEKINGRWTEKAVQP